MCVKAHDYHQKKEMKEKRRRVRERSLVVADVAFLLSSLYATPSDAASGNHTSHDLVKVKMKMVVTMQTGRAL